MKVKNVDTLVLSIREGLFIWLTFIVHNIIYTYTHTQVFLDVVGDGEFFPNSKPIDWLAQVLCPFDKDIEQLCENVLFLICGFDVKTMNLVSSVQLLLHWVVFL